MNTNELIQYILQEKMPTISVETPTGRYPLEGDSYYNVDEYEPKLPEQGRFEAHRKYIDIQYLLQGEEKIYVTDVEKLKELQPYSDEKDVAFYSDPDGDEAACHTVKAGEYLIFYPNDAHKPSIRSCEGVRVKKVVFKVKIDE